MSDKDKVKVIVSCDCSCADACPQGRAGSQAKCRIWRDTRIMPTIDRDPKPGKAPDQIFEIRVRLPAGLSIIEVNAAPFGQMTPRYMLAIEDVRLAIDGLDEASREAKERLQNLVDGSHIRCDVLTDRVVTLEGKVDGEIEARLDVIVNRINALESHTGRNAMAERIDGLSLELDTLRDEVVQNFQAGDQLAEVRRKRMEVLEKMIIPQLSDKLDRTRKAFTSLLERLGMEVGDFGRVRMKRAEARERFEQAMTDGCGDDPPRQDEATIKPVIKGGWFNVYLYDDGAIDLRMTFSNMWTTQDAALRWMRRDVRFGNRKAVACIQIPDITEGEGL